MEWHRQFVCHGRARQRFAEEKDDQRRVDQKDIFYRVILFLATVTFRLFSSVLGADDAPFRPVMGKRGESGPATGASSTKLTPRTAAPPSVPTMMRHLPPGSLDPQARKDPLAHAHAPHSERCRGGRRPGWRP